MVINLKNQCIKLILNRKLNQKFKIIEIVNKVINCYQIEKMFKILLYKQHIKQSTLNNNKLKTQLKSKFKN